MASPITVRSLEVVLKLTADEAIFTTQAGWLAVRAAIEALWDVDGDQAGPAGTVLEELFAFSGIRGKSDIELEADIEKMRLEYPLVARLPMDSVWRVLRAADAVANLPIEPIGPLIAAINGRLKPEMIRHKLNVASAKAPWTRTEQAWTAQETRIQKLQEQVDSLNASLADFKNLTTWITYKIPVDYKDDVAHPRGQRMAIREWVGDVMSGDLMKFSKAIGSHRDSAGDLKLTVSSGEPLTVGFGEPSLTPAGRLKVARDLANKDAEKRRAAELDPKAEWIPVDPGEPLTVTRNPPIQQMDYDEQ